MRLATREQVLAVRGKVVELRFRIAAVRLGGLLSKYRSDQARIPAGHPNGGQWTDDPRSVHRQDNAGKWDERRLEECEAQFESDMLQCRMVPWNPFCVDQALSRRTACMKGDPIPDLFHIM
jgi:hypothetical protein